MAETYFNFNTIKREKLRKSEIRETIKTMRQSLPVYTIDEIREYRMPYFQALITNLEEKGFHSSSSFIKQLVEFQTKAREEAGPGSNIWMRPQLRYSNKELKYLSEELHKAEECHHANDHVKECDTFLRLGIYFAFSLQDWWWLGEQILVESINVSGNYSELQGKFEALSRFAYAKFLITNLKECDNAKEQLLIARELCTTKGQNLKSYFPNETGTLYMRINYYTYKCLIKEAKIVMATDYKKAIEIAITAKKRAAEACYKEGETNALTLKGLCEMNIDDPKTAILSFNKALKIQKELGNPEGMCKVMIQLAKAYLMDNQTNESLHVLNALKETAAKHNLHFYVAQAYKNMGEYYLNNGQYSTARALLNNSLNLFEKETNSVSDVARVQTLEAIAWGLELLPTYIDLIGKSGNTAGACGLENLTKLVDWKDSRKPFWDENAITDHTSFVDTIEADQKAEGRRASMIEKYKEERKSSRKKSKKMSRTQESKKQAAPEIDVDVFIKTFINANVEDIVTKTPKKTEHKVSIAPGSSDVEELYDNREKGSTESLNNNRVSFERAK